MERKKKSWLGWLLLVLSLLGLLTAFVIFLRSRKRAEGSRQDQETEPENNQQNDDVTPKEFYELVDKVLGEGVSMVTKRIITAQAMHETGVFTSTVFVENNNPFGMRQPQKRETTSIGESKGYAVYESLEASIRDLQMWFDYNQIPLEFSTASAYSAKIREYSYYEAPYADYTAALKAHLKKLDASML